jgi:hypothetical protein
MKIVFAICLTVYAMTLAICATNILVEHEKGQNIRDAIRLYQMARPLLQKPSLEIPSGTNT